jgi:hypothetical protein
MRLADLRYRSALLKTALNIHFIPSNEVKLKLEELLPFPVVLNSLNANSRRK